MEAFFPAYLQSTSRPDPSIEVSPSVKIINNRHCRQLGIPTSPTTKRRHQHFADFHHLTSWRDPASDILLVKYIYKSVFSVACSFCTNPGWDRGRAYFWYFAWGGGDHLNLWIWARMTWWPYLSENYITPWIRLCHLSTICFHFREDNFGGLTRIQNKGLLTRWWFLDNWRNISRSKILFV